MELYVRFIKSSLDSSSISIRVFAEAIGYDRSYISRVLNNAIKPSQDVVVAMLGYFGLDFKDTEAVVVHHDALLDELYRSLVYFDNEESHRTFLKLSHFMDLLTLLDKEFEFEVLKCFYYQSYYPDKNSIDYFENLKATSRNTSKRYEAIYFDVLAVLYKDSGNYLKALEILESTQSDVLPIDVLSMIYYHLVMIYTRLGIYNKAFIYNTKAMELFQQQRNHLRVLSCQFHEANLHSNFKDYDLAYREYTEVLNQAMKYDDEYLIGSCYFNLSLLLLKQKQHENALQYLNKAENYFPHDIEIIVHKCDALMNLGCIDELEKYYANNIRYIELNSPQYYEIMVIRCHAKNALNQDYLELLLDYDKRFRGNDDVERNNLFLDLLIAHYESISKYKEAVYYHKIKEQLRNRMKL